MSVRVIVDRVVSALPGTRNESLERGFDVRKESLLVFVNDYSRGGVRNATRANTAIDIVRNDFFDPLGGLYVDEHVVCVRLNRW